MRVPTSALDELRRAGRHACRIAKHLPARPMLALQGLRDTTVRSDATVALLCRLRCTPRRLLLEDADHRLLRPGAPGHDELLRALQRFGHERLGRLG